MEKKEFKEFMDNLSEEENKGVTSFLNKMIEEMAKESPFAKCMDVRYKLDDIIGEISEKIIFEKREKELAEKFSNVLIQITNIINDFKKEHM